MLPIVNRPDQSGGPLPGSGCARTGTAGEDDPIASSRRSLGLRAPAVEGILETAGDGEGGGGAPRGKRVYDSKASPGEAGEIAIFCVCALTPEIGEKSHNTVQYRCRRAGPRQEPEDDGQEPPVRGARQVFDRQRHQDTRARDLRNAATSRNIALPGQKDRSTMKLSSVFYKTPKGLDEISTRAHHLPARMRAMLILVDGHRTGSELVALSSSSSEGRKQLTSLLSGGFVQTHAPGRRSAATGPGHGTPAAAADDDISLARSYAVRSLRELLGEEATSLVAEIEQLRTIDELQQHLGRLRAALRAAPDQARARQFLDQIEMVLD